VSLDGFITGTSAHVNQVAEFGPVDALRILVVGAGLAGLALARALGRAGFEPEVVERAAAFSDVGAGIYLPGNAARALRALELEEAVAERAAAIGRQRFANHRGRLLGEVDLPRFWGRLGPCLALHRADLHAVLREGVPVRLGCAVRSLERVAGPVEVGFADGRQAAYDLVVGADGLHSTVRRLAVDGRPPAPVGQQSWRWVAADPPEAGTWSVLLGRGASFLTIPIGGGRVYCYADVLGGPAAAGGDPAARLGERFAGFADPVPELVARLPDPGRIHVAPIEQVAQERWGRGAVVLVGDAAHAMSPNMAQGAALAFEDALVLAEELRAAGSLGEALAGFVARRRPRTSWVRAQTHRRDRTRNLPPPLRDPLLRALGQRIYQANYRPLLDPY
jgi:FAD-dependent urate hydroxylase